ncbi:MAG: hypothetical protein ACJAS4_000516 [Bacteriovoracaceae bacterium]|jgi:hypothetical protein
MKKLNSNMSKKYDLFFLAIFLIYILGSIIIGYGCGYESETMFHRLSALGKLGSCYILCVALFHLFVEKVNSFQNLVSFILAVVLTETEFFEGFLYQIFSYDLEINLGNSQYPKLICFFSVFFGMIIKFFLRKKHFAHFFNLLAMAAVITTTIVFHKVIVRESYVEMRDLYYSKMNIFQYLTDQDLFSVCRKENLLCFSWKGDKSFNTLVGDEQLASKFSQSMAKEEVEEGTRIYEGQFDFGDREENLDLENVLVIKKKTNKFLTFVFDLNSSGRIRDKFFKLFYILSAFAHLFWSVFMFYLIRLHYNRKFCLRAVVLR